MLDKNRMALIFSRYKRCLSLKSSNILLLYGFINYNRLLLCFLVLSFGAFNWPRLHEALRITLRWTEISKKEHFQKGPGKRPRTFEFTPFLNALRDENNSDTLLVDCSHPKIASLTHHRGCVTPEGISGDTSTDLVISAVKLDHTILHGKTKVSVNHFDIDGFLSVMALLHADIAMKHASLWQTAARIGDFREFNYQCWLNEFREKRKVGKESILIGSTDLGLKICCLINTLEKKEFRRPYEDASDARKWPYFTANSDVLWMLQGISEPSEALWREEYTQVLSHCEILNKDSRITKYRDIGVVVIETAQPLHYYSLFSCCDDCDIVVVLYEGNRYEIEQRYTSYVELASRPVLPRVSLLPLAKILNDLEMKCVSVGSTEGRKLSWEANNIQDTGPLLRINKCQNSLSKAQRYGHPFERPIHPSSIDPSVFKIVVLSYFRYAYPEPEKLRQCSVNWDWKSMSEYNERIQWQRFY